MNKYDAIIIGSGIGGLATALMLSQQGRKVLLLEKNKFLGGRLSSFKRDGFNVDLGVHVISRSDKGPIGEVLRRVGIANPISYTTVRPLSSYHGKTFIFPRDLKDMVSEADFNALTTIMKDINLMSEEQVKSYDDVDLKTFLLSYTKDPLILACFCNISTIYVCLPTWLTSAGEFMRCLRMEAQARSSGYPEGGCAVITNTYAEGVRRFGGEIKSGVRVDKIEVEDGKVSGVVAGDQVYKADVVISNGDIRSTVLALAGSEYFPKDYVDYVRGLQYSWSGPVVRVALDKKVTDIKMLTQFGTTDQEGYYEKMANGIMPEELNLFVVIPTNFSPSVGPEGKQLVCIASPMPLGTPKTILEQMTEGMIETARKYIPNLRDDALWTNTMTVDQLDKMVGESGAGIGIGQRPGQCGDKRPGIKTPLEGLYIVGAEAGGTGVGTELAVNSAMEFIDKHSPFSGRK
ncbi:MAG: NAD(P)/FAD-dependent oxidoreductase [Deltaproteobacteria bacterium]|nr:NAD(P)/FAD-dependent oxidoreductase [Deltaproteobacteria bacterium]